MGLDIAMFTYTIFYRRDSLHFGGRVGVDDAEVHLPGSLPKTGPILTAPLIPPTIDILTVIN